MCLKPHKMVSGRARIQPQICLTPKSNPLPHDDSDLGALLSSLNQSSSTVSAFELINNFF